MLMKNKNKKGNKKNKIRLLSFLSALLILLTSCVKNSNNSRKANINSNNTGNSYNNYVSGSTLHLDNPLIKQGIENNSIIEIKPDSIEYKDYTDTMDNMTTTYEYEKLYEIDYLYNRYMEIKDKKVEEHSYQIDNLIVETLLKSVKANNKKYLEEKEKEYTSAFYEEFDDNYLKQICQIVIDTINYFNENNMIEDIEEVKCVLGNLKIFSSISMSNAYVSDDDCLMINKSMIDTLKIKKSSKDQDVLKDTISHESIHLIQKSCTDTQKIKQCIGNSYKFDNSKVDSLNWKWFYEGSAEKCSNDYTKDNPLVYEYYINYIESITTATILKDANTVTQVESTSLSKKMDSLFNLFNAETEEEQKEILKLMYSLEIIENEDEDFLNQFNEPLEKEELIKIKRNLKASVCETLTKYFYKNLSEYITKNQVTMSDIYFLITIFESDIDYHINYSDEEKFEDNKEFMKKYLEIQDAFFNMISLSTEIPFEEISTNFNNYGIMLESGEYNFTLEKLTNEKKDYFLKQLSKLKQYGTEQIRDSYERENNSSKTLIK